jgi:hypothetical protein
MSAKMKIEGLCDACGGSMRSTSEHSGALSAILKEFQDLHAKCREGK